MGSFISTILSPLTDSLSKLGDTAKKFITNDQDRMAFATQLDAMQEAFQAKLLEADQAFVNAQAQVIETEAKGESWLQRNWRPLSMLSFVAVILYQFIISDIFSLPKATTLPDDLWGVIKIGFGGYVTGRSVEKVAQSDSAKAFAQAIAAKLAK